jgi:hypothetical protein
MSDQLSLRRLGLLLRNDFARGQRALWIATATIGLLALLGPLSPFSGEFTSAGSYRALFLAALFTWGTVMTSLAFTDLHGRATNTAFLLLPATALEKTVARLLASTAFLIVFLLLYVSALSLLGEALEVLGLSGENEWFSPLDPIAWVILPHYLVVQALFFLGAAWFRRLHYMKTVFALTVVCTAVVAGYMAIAWVLGWVSWSGTGIRIRGDAYDGIYRPLRNLFEVGELAYFIVLPFFCWFVAWLRVKETQVSHGV